MIDLHYTGTPNGQKIAIMLEEIGAAYRIIPYDIFEGDQLTPEFGRINPNLKLPAIVDHAPAAGGSPITVFESCAILQYLAEKSGQLWAPSGAARATTLSWLMWQAAGLGPMGGQLSHFMRYAPAGQDYAIERYSREMMRLLTVLEKRLASSAYVGGEDYSIADIAIWPGQAFAASMGRLDAYPAMKAWVERIRTRPAVIHATTRPELRAPEKYLGRHQKLNEAEWSNMFGAANHNAVQRD